MKILYFILFSLFLFPVSTLLSQSHVELLETSSDNIKLLVRKADDLKFELPDSANIYYVEALEMAQLENDTSGMIGVISKIGGAYYILGDYHQALNSFFESLKLSQLNRNKTGIAIGYNNIGIILSAQGKNNQAIEYHRKSIVLCEQLKDSLMMEKNFFNLGIVFSSLKEFDSALYYTYKAQEVCDLIEYPREKMRTYNLLGEIYFERGEFRKAFDFYSIIVKDKNYNNNWERCYALSGIARTSLKLGYPNEAIRYALISDTLAKDIHALWDLQRIREILAQAYAAKGDFQNAYVNQIAFKQLSDSLLNKEKEQEMNYLHMLQKDLENKELKHSFDQQEERIKNQKLLNGIYFLVGFVLLLLALLLWRNLALKNRLNRRLKAQNSLIASKNKELMLLNATKDRFFHMVAHDLKSPLSAMISFTDILQTNLELFDETQIREFLESLHQSSSQGFKLLENLLDWARLQTNVITYQPHELKLYPLIEDTMVLLQGNATNKDIGIDLVVDQDLMALIDRNMFLTVLRNLVSNAIKYSHPGNRISIEAERLNKTVFVRVKDQGIGIPEEERLRLFNIESYFSRPGTNQEKGTGIGLVLCHDFVNKWGGKISVESTEGQGSCFTFTVPTF